PVVRALPAGIILHHFTMAHYHICALDGSGAAWCMGLGDDYRLGTGDATSSSTFREVVMPQGVSFAQMDCGYNGCCAVDTLGDGWCWGKNLFGESGTGDETTVTATPVRVLMPPGSHFKSIKRYNHVCGLDVTGVGFCWGSNLYGRIGIGDMAVAYSATPLQVLTPVGISFTFMELSLNASCALSTTGEVYCWGSGSSWEQGDGSSETDAAPTPVTMPAGTSFIAVSGGTTHFCALDQYGYPWCWGSGSQGEMGDGETSENSVPSQIARAE
ncbi:hypothetical protein KKF84_19025, partial [Myxococcota bacterium]|nr:hypothetical protein [Myxococcota bacterium]